MHLERGTLTPRHPLGGWRTVPFGRGLLVLASLLGLVSVPLAAGWSTAASAASLPTVYSVAPNYGPPTGGTAVTVSGTGFAGVTAVDFGAVAASAVTVVSTTQITVTSPAEVAGTADVTVIAAGGTSTTNAGDQFTFTNLVPPTNNLIIGSGSQASWALNEQFDQLFNSVPGCQMQPEAVQQLDFSCAATPRPSSPGTTAIWTIRSTTSP
jgi:hypothetical protein